MEYIGFADVGKFVQISGISKDDFEKKIAPNKHTKISYEEIYDDRFFHSYFIVIERSRLSRLLDFKSV